jgi:hypothetical protein
MGPRADSTKVHPALFSYVQTLSRFDGGNSCNTRTSPTITNTAAVAATRLSAMPVISIIYTTDICITRRAARLPNT